MPEKIEGSKFIKATCKVTGGSRTRIFGENEWDEAVEWENGK